jgi:hypothetical protein
MPDSSTLKTSFADGGRCSIFVLVDSFLASAKSIPHFTFHLTCPFALSIIKVFIAAILDLFILFPTGLILHRSFYHYEST